MFKLQVLLSPISYRSQQSHSFSGLRRLRLGQRGRRARGVPGDTAKDAQVEPHRPAERTRRGTGENQRVRKRIIHIWHQQHLWVFYPPSPPVTAFEVLPPQTHCERPIRMVYDRKFGNNTCYWRINILNHVSFSHFILQRSPASRRSSVRRGTQLSDPIRRIRYTKHSNHQTEIL